MTKLQNYERKFGNAVRALRGGVYSVPQPHAVRRVKLWEMRLKRAKHPLPTVTVWV
jgi:hypothetical protein